MKSKKKEKSIFEVAAQAIKKQPDTRNPMELIQEFDSDKLYGKNINECLERHKKKFPGDFYIVAMYKNQLLPNVIHFAYCGRISCPTPMNKQIVYKYHRNDDKLELLWVIPDDITCHTYSMNRAIVDKSEFGLLRFVLEFLDGTLLRRAKELNNEL
jgi:hypothetical protein